MKKWYHLSIKHNLLLLLILVILLPSILFLYGLIVGEKHQIKWTKSNYRLFGVTDVLEKPIFDWQTMQDHQIQNYLQKDLENNLPLRSWLIRFSNQFYFDVFKKSYSYGNNIIVGKNNELFEKWYIQSYCGLLAGKEDDNPVLMAEWVDKLKKMNDRLAKKGKLFIYLITPNKAEYMPAFIPNRYHCSDHESKRIKMMTQLLDKNHILYVNAVSLLQNANDQFHFPLFPQGGTHWNSLGAVIVVNDILNKINKTSIAFTYSHSFHPTDTDHDLMSLLNLFKPNKHYLVPDIIYKNKQSASPLKITIVGGSFNNKIVDVLAASNSFSKIDFYFYYKLSRTEYNNGELTKIDRYDAPTDIINHVQSSDVIILEENSSSFITNHGKLLYDTLQQSILG